MRARQPYSLGALVLVSSCALGPQRIALGLRPNRLTTCPAVTSAPRLRFHVVDERRVREHCGSDLSGPVQQRSTMVPDRPVPLVVTEALETRARELGYDVGESGVPVTISLNEVMNRLSPALFSTHAEATVRWLVRVGEPERASYLRLVEGYAHQPEGTGFPETAEETLNAALARAVDTTLCDGKLADAVTGRRPH